MLDTLQEDSLGKKLMTQTFWVYFFTALAAPIAYATRAIIANKLPLDEVGIFYSVMSLITILASYNDLWLTEAMQYFLPKYRIEKKRDAYKTTFYLTFWLQIITGITGVIIIYLTAPRLAEHHFHSEKAVHILYIFAWYFLWINILQVLGAYFSAFQNVFYAHFLTFSKQTAILCLILFSRSTHGAIDGQTISHATVYGIYITLGIAACLFISSYRKTFTWGKIRFDTWLLKTQISYARGILLATNAGVLLSNIDQQLVIQFLWAEAAWIYANYMILLVIYGVLTWPFLALIFPIVTELVTKQQREKYTLLQNILYKYYSLLSLIIAGLFVALWPEIAMVFFWTKFSFSGTLISVSAPFLVFNIMLAVNFTFLAGLGKIKQRVHLLIYALVLNIVSNLLFLLVFDLGLRSPVIATIISRLFLWYWSFRSLHTYQPITVAYWFLLKNCAIIVVLTTTIFIYKSWFFVYSNAFRRQNAAYIWGISLLYAAVIVLINRQQIRLLRSYLRSFRQQS